MDQNNATGRVMRHCRCRPLFLCINNFVFCFTQKDALKTHGLSVLTRRSCQNENCGFLFKQSYFGVVEGVYGPQNTPMIWQFIIARTKERFEGHTHPQPPKKFTHLLRGFSPIHSTHWRGVQGLMSGTREPFPLEVAMVVAVVTPVVFCAKATEKCNKNTKTSCL